MKNSRVLLIGFIAALMLIFGYKLYGPEENNQPKTSNTIVNSSEVMTEEALKADFDYFMSLIKNDYPYLAVNQRLNNVNFLDNEPRYWQSVKGAKTKGEFASRLSEIIGELNNGHTDLIPLDDQNRTRDMYYKVYSGIVEEGGSLAINYKPWVETLKRKESVALYGPLPNLNKAATGEAQTQDEVFPNNVETQVIKDGQVAYIKIKSFNFFNEKADQPTIHSFIKANLSAKALVIDIRENGGGSTEYFKNILVEPLLKKPLSITRYNLMRSGMNNKPYIEAITKANPGAVKPISELDPSQFPKAQPEVFTIFDSFISDTMTYSPKNSLGFNGNIYVLVSGRVYSASEAFASFCKDTGFATLIGQRTGGDGYGTDPALFCLPNSGIIGRYPLQYGMMANGEANEEVKTQPDYVINQITVMNDLSLDKCVQKVIELEKL